MMHQFFFKFGEEPVNFRKRTTHNLNEVYLLTPNTSS
jgi:hypothetical protein